MDSLESYEERENKYIMWNRSQPIEQDALQNNPGYPLVGSDLFDIIDVLTETNLSKQ